MAAILSREDELWKVGQNLIQITSWPDWSVSTDGENGSDDSLVLLPH